MWNVLGRQEQRDTPTPFPAGLLVKPICQGPGTGTDSQEEPKCMLNALTNELDVSWGGWDTVWAGWEFSPE